MRFSDSRSGAAALAPTHDGLGSGNPTRIICSALIAQAFEVVRYPILPKITRLESAAAGREILQIRHSSLYAPRDFDISPYFQIVKPTLVKNFNYKIIDWADLPAQRAACTTPNRSFHSRKEQIFFYLLS